MLRKHWPYCPRDYKERECHSESRWVGWGITK